MVKADTGGSSLPLKEIGIIAAAVVALVILIVVIVHTARQFQPQVVMTVHPPIGGGKSAYLAQNHLGKFANGGPSTFKMPAGGLAAGIDPTR